MRKEKFKLVKRTGKFTTSLLLVTSLSSIPALVYAEEMSVDNLEAEDPDSTNEITQGDQSELIQEILTGESDLTKDNLQDETNEVKDDLENNEKDIQEDVLYDNNVDSKENNQEIQNENIIKSNLDEDELLVNEAQTNNLKQTEETNEVANATENDVEPHKVSVIVNKVDEKGEMLKGATLQIIDSNGNIVDEWISDENPHTLMLPEGDYVLHEKYAPLGYEVAADRSFTVLVSINEINAGVDHDDDHAVCWHYGGVALYYVESKGEKQEVYCINQGLEEPDNTSYDGVVLTSDNITNFTPDMDDSLSSEELYDKILDIIYHRGKASNLFPELSETAIRYVTEFALKNYTSAKILEGDHTTLQYRDYRYDPDTKQGFVKEAGTGDAIGQLAKHWWYFHGRQKLPARYAELFYYLISADDPHPDNMYLYIYSTKEMTSAGENYQNLLGVRWFSPYDEDYEIDLDYVNKLKNIENLKTQNGSKKPKVIKETKKDIIPEEIKKVEQRLEEPESKTIESYIALRECLSKQIPQTSDENNIGISFGSALLGGMALVGSALVKKKKLVKRR